MKLRSDYKDEFVAKHAVKLGLMSCFVKVPTSIMCCQPVTGYLVHDFADPVFGRPLFLLFKTSQSSMLSSMVMTSYTETTLMSALLLALPR
jgi:hypothetical protein